VLIVLGIIFAFKEYADLNLFSYIGKAWPLFFIGLGAWLILKEKGNSNSNF
jgi:phage shock protein C